MSYRGFGSDYYDGERDYNRRGRPDYERDRYASYGPDRDYMDGFNYAQREDERGQEERAIEEATERRRESERQEYCRIEREREEMEVAEQFPEENFPEEVFAESDPDRREKEAQNG